MVKVGQSFGTQFKKYVPPLSVNINAFKIPKSKISYVNFYFLYEKFGLNLKPFPAPWVRKKSDRYFFYRWWKVLPKLVGLRVGVYVGNKFHSFRVRPQAMGSYLGSFVRTSKVPINLHFKKKNVYRSKKGVSVVSSKNKSSNVSKKVSKKKLFFYNYK